jgi:hypothetical protein
MPTMRSVIGAFFVLVDYRNGHDLSPRESPSRKSVLVFGKRLFKTVQGSNQCWDLMRG